jgi:signal transduction histidine kinase
MTFMVFVIRQESLSSDALASASDRLAAVKDTVAATLSALKDAETGQRGYLITGKSAYLAPYDAGLRDFDSNIAKLVRLTESDPVVAPLVASIREIAARKRAEMAETLDVFRTSGQAPAFTRVSSDIGKHYMDELRNVASRIIAIENEAYSRTSRAQADSERTARWESIVSVLALFLLTLTGTLLLTRELRHQRRLAANLDASEKRYRELAETLEQQVEARTRELQQLNQELTAFSYSVSHDLRAPLRAIDGFSRILLEDYSCRLDANGLNLLTRISDAAQRMAQLIHSLLELARVTRQPLDRQPVSISDFAASTIQHLMMASPDRHVDVSIAPGLVADADPPLIRVLLDNLLGNAWKFTSKTPHARIEVGQTDVSGKPVFFVRDNGPGFDPAAASRLFRPFQRLHSESEFPGDGIGLAAVQRVVNRHGGFVWAEGSPNQGATIFFALS